MKSEVDMRYGPSQHINSPKTYFEKSRTRMSRFSRPDTIGVHYSAPTFPILPHQQELYRQLYIKTTENEVPCPETLGYTQGKTLGSGTYAKVKAAWSPFERKMVRIVKDSHYCTGSGCTLEPLALTRRKGGAGMSHA